MSQFCFAVNQLYVGDVNIATASISANSKEIQEPFKLRILGTSVQFFRATGCLRPIVQESLPPPPYGGCLEGVCDKVLCPYGSFGSIEKLVPYGSGFARKDHDAKRVPSQTT